MVKPRDDTHKGHEPEYTDPELQTTTQDKIEFPVILFKQLDYVRFLRTQDTGDFSIFQLDIVNPNQLAHWLKNINRYVNSVKALKSLLKHHHNKVFEDLLIKIDKDHKEEYKKKTKDLKDAFQKEKKTMQNILNYNNAIKVIKKEFALEYTCKQYDEIFEACIKLIQEAGYFGDEFIVDKC